MIYLIFLFTILFFILAWHRLDLAVMFLIAALPVYLIRFNIFGLPSTLLEAMIWAVFSIWFVKNFRDIFENLKFRIKNWKNTIPLSPPLSRGKNRYPFDWEIALLLVVALVAAGVAGFSASSLGIFKAYFFEPVLLFIVVLNVVRYNANAANELRMPRMNLGIEKILWVLAVSALAVSLLAIYQKITGQLIDNPVWAAAATRRVVSFFGYPNAVGLYLGPIILVMTGWFLATLSFPKAKPIAPHLRGGGISTNTVLDCSSVLTSAQKKKTVCLRGNDKEEGVVCNEKLKMIFISLTIISSILSIYFVKSKGALLGVAAGLVVFGLLASKKARWATVAVALIAAVGILSFQPARQAALNTVSFKTLSGQIRLAGWSDAWKMLTGGRLITGAGLANYQAAVAPYHTPGIFIKDPNDPDAQRKLVFNAAYRAAHWQPLEIYLYPHNIVLNFWSELGLSGLLLFIWIIGKFFVIGIWGLFGHWSLGFGNLEMQKDRYIIVGLICAMAVVVVHGIVDVPYFKNDLAAMFWLLVAMMSLIKLESQFKINK